MWFKEYSTIKYKILTFFSDIWKSMFSLKMGFSMVYSFHFTFCITRKFGSHLQESPSQFNRKTSVGCRFPFWSCDVWCVRILTSQQNHRSGNQFRPCNFVTVHGSKIQHAGNYIEIKVITDNLKSNHFPFLV